MVEALVATGGLGLLLGLRYRVPAALAASGVAAIAAIVVALFTAASRWAVLIAPLCAVAALQCGYLGGLLLASAIPHAKLPRYKAGGSAAGRRLSRAATDDPPRRSGPAGSDRAPAPASVALLDIAER